MFTSLVLINNIYHRQLILRTIYDSIHINHVILISSHFYYYLHLALYYFTFIFIIFVLMSNWYMIITFVLNLGTATVFIFVICKLTYCIEFTKFVYFFFFLSLTSRFLYLLFLNNVVVLVAYVIAVAPIVWVSRSYLDIYRNY